MGVCERVKAKLSPDLRIVLEDTAKVRGAVEGGVLRLECLPGFVYGRFNRQETLDRVRRRGETGHGARDARHPVGA